jgi:hypothetical protein
MQKLLFLLTFLLILNIGYSQFKNLKDKVLGDKSPIGSLVKKPPAISTNFDDDVKMEGSLPADFGNDKEYFPLYNARRSASDGFVLCPGFYEMTNMSYCLKAGTYGPSAGDGYMYAPTVGKMDDIINAILYAHETQHAEIPQRDVQVLLWAIIAKAKFKNLGGKTKLVAGLLLTPQQIVKLNGGMVETLGDEALSRNLVDLPAPVRAVMEAENKIRSMVESGIDEFEAFERVAIMAGMAPNDHPEVVRGMWALHPDEYYIRYMPSGYSRTHVQIYVPENKGEVLYNAIGTIACPANTGAQRLAQTNIKIATSDGKAADPCNATASIK